MFELIFCSLLTIFPDYLFRRYVQGKRIGREITLFSVWYELRIGLTACLLLTISLITLIFYYHPSTSNVTSFFRTVTILPETPGRVVEVLVTNGEIVEAGDVLFRLDSSSQEAAVVTARQGLAEVEAARAVAQWELATAQGQVDEAEASRDRALDELPLFVCGTTITQSARLHMRKHHLPRRLHARAEDVARVRLRDENITPVLATEGDVGRRSPAGS